MNKRSICLFFVLFITRYAMAQVSEIKFGTEFHFSTASSIAQDKSGNVYIAGFASAPFELKWKSFTGNFQPSNNTKDIYVIKFNSSFEIQWCKLLGGPGEERDPKITTDADGNLYVAASYTKGWNTGAATGPAFLENPWGHDVSFIAKMDARGTVQWARPLHQQLRAYFSSITVTHNNQLLVSGHFGKPSILKNNVPAELPPGDKREYYVSFIKTLDLSGADLFTKYFEARNLSFVKGAISDKKNNFYVFGYFTDTSEAIIKNPNYTPLSSIKESRGAFIEKINEQGKTLWRKEIGKLRGTERRYVRLNDIAVDEHEQVYYCGYFRDSIYPGLPKKASLQGVKYDDVLIGKLNAAGQTAWMKSFGSAGDDYAKSIFYNEPENKLLVGGDYEGAIPLTQFQNQQQFDKPKDVRAIFLTELDTAGNYVLSVVPESPNSNTYSHAILHQQLGYIMATHLGYWHTGIFQFKPGNWNERMAAAANKTLASDYENGYTALQQKKYNEAITWFKKAAATGNAEAMFSLGVVYQEGGGAAFPPNGKEALLWYEKAAAKGNGKAMYNLGILYASGNGVPVNNEEARKWFGQAAAKGLAEAKEALTKLNAAPAAATELVTARAFFDKKEYPQALEWYKKGAGKGDAEAFYMLGHLHFWGLGTPKNLTTARQWYEQAAAKGHEKAKSALAGMDDESGF